MDIKLVVLDLDGTLLKAKWKIHPDNLQAIQRIYEQRPDVKVVIATGRAPSSTIKHAKTCQIHEKAGHMICYNGGSVIDIVNDEQKVLFQKNLTVEQSQKIFDFAVAHNLNFWGYSIDNQTAFINHHSLKVWLTERFNKLKVIKTNNRNEIPALYKVLLFCKHHQVNPMIDQLTALGDLELATSSHNVIEVNPLGVNKAAAVQFLCQKWDIKPEQVLACGDGMNDYKLIKWAKYGIAMANAGTTLKEVAFDITTKNTQGGVAKAIEKYVLTPAETTNN